ncbi:MAG: GNAT family N-acetyltransferase [Pirellulales bacterium]|nr:GNAT family N-acetyltransferase [Pirellulales bacterium]
MTELVIERVATRRQRNEFLEFPWTLYRGDPCWIPPLRDSQREMVGYKAHPFYERNVAQTFLARRDGEVVGRIAAILNHGHNEQYHERRGFFGFFDCRDDAEAAHGLFDAVGVWFARQGIFQVRGPTNPSLNYELGLLIEGFDSAPTFMMTYNPPYYPRLIEDYGFRKTQDLVAFWGHVGMLPQIAAKYRHVAEQIVERYHVKLRNLDTARFREDVETFLSIYNRSLVNTWGFVPMTPGEVRHMAGGLKWLIIPEMAIAAEIDGRVVGAAFGLPDYNPRIRQIDGRLFPFGFVRLLRNRRAIKKIRLISTNVLPEYQHFGLGLVLLDGLVPKALEWGLEEAEFSWVLESNTLSYGSLKKGGAKITKTYRIYDLELTPEGKPQVTAQGSGVERTGPSPAPAGSEVRGQDSESDIQHSLLPPSPWKPSVSFPPSTEPLHIREVQSRKDLDAFIDLPWRIYAEDPQWVPPLRSEVRAFLDRRRHPFYLHGEATAYLAQRGGQAVGRILVSDDPNFNREQGTNLGCFGMFESAPDAETARALIDAAADWLRARGRDAVWGPIDYSMNYPCGLLIDGFNAPPRILMTHNPPYYRPLLESLGFGKLKDLYCWWFDDSLNLVQRWREKAERIIRRGRIVVRPFNLDDYEGDVERCHQVYNASMARHWGYVRMTPEEFRHYARQVHRIAQPNQVFLAEIDGQTVGVAVTVPDVNEAIRPLDGRLFRFGLPLGALRAARNMKRIRTARMIVLDVMEGYRRRGIAEMLILRTLDYGKNVLNYTGAELSWTLEDNQHVNRTIEGVGGRRYKTYRIFEKKI